MKRLTESSEGDQINCAHASNMRIKKYWASGTAKHWQFDLCRWSIICSRVAPSCINRPHQHGWVCRSNLLSKIEAKYYSLVHELRCQKVLQVTEQLRQQVTVWNRWFYHMFAKRNVELPVKIQASWLALERRRRESTVNYVKNSVGLLLLFPENLSPQYSTIKVVNWMTKASRISASVGGRSRLLVSILELCWSTMVLIRAVDEACNDLSRSTSRALRKHTVNAPIEV